MLQVGLAEINEFVETCCVVCGNFLSDESYDDPRKFYEKFFDSPQEEELQLEKERQEFEVKEGLTCCLFVNLIVHTFAFPLKDGTFPDRDKTVRQNKAVRSLKRELHPYGDADLIGFPEWWEEIRGPNFLETAGTDVALNGAPAEVNGEEPPDELLEWGKTEYIGGVHIERLVHERNRNIERWPALSVLYHCGCTGRLFASVLSVALCVVHQY